jgi:hypothetical protein
MFLSRTPPSTEDLLEALAATLELGVAPIEALALVARAGPASARVARQLSEALRTQTLTVALTVQKLLAPEERALVAFAEETARLPSALRWVVERRRIRSERHRVLVGSTVGPLLFTVLTLVAEQVPAVFLGTSSFWGTLRTIVLVGASVACVVLGLTRAPRLPRARLALSRVPLLSSLLQLDDEAATDALITVFADRNDLALTLPATRALYAGPYAEALAAVAADPLGSVPTFSEPFALALRVGLRVGDLPARLAAFHRAAQAKLTARLRVLARVLAYTVLSVVVLHGLLKFLSSPLPGIGGDLGNSPEMRELERELENAGH